MLDTTVRDMLRIAHQIKPTMLIYAPEVCPKIMLIYFPVSMSFLVI
jgi:hypothetical protein